MGSTALGANHPAVVAAKASGASHLDVVVLMQRGKVVPSLPGFTASGGAGTGMAVGKVDLGKLDDFVKAVLSDSDIKVVEENRPRNSRPPRPRF
jgi:hypothetical protein